MSGAQSFGRYRVTGSLGAGAMGEVLAAVDELLGREVAVKTLRGRTSGLAARIADERFRLEARAIAQLTHPSVVQVYDLDLAADPPYLVMERVAGPSLKERLAAGPLPEFEVRALGIQIANALAAAHARGVVHRDVKPANILGAGPGTWKLADFGVAHVPDSSLTITGQFVGSPAYAPPEALIRGQLGPEGDVFSLGATLYQAATGTWPRADATMSGLLAPVPPLCTIAPDVAPDLAAAIDRAVSVEPTARPGAAELALALASGTSTAPGVAAVALPVPAAGWSGAGASGAGATASSATSAGATATGDSALAKAAQYRWKHMVAGIATLLAIVLIAATRCSASDPPGAPATIPAAGGRGETTADEREGREGRDGREGRGDPPSMIQARPPELTSEEAAEDWDKVIDKLYKRQFGEARRKLAEWETKHGETPETRDLASQLDALPEHVLRGRGKGRGRGRD
ncbi:MAG TPA: serine/threonine-protein kinase [Kofleriaceae bacterium]|nr:serine/threonine-protein kinase [Kofleriaceae bacterium]